MSVTDVTFAILTIICVTLMIVAGVGEVLYVSYRLIKKLLKK